MRHPNKTRRGCLHPTRKNGKDSATPIARTRLDPRGPSGEQIRAQPYRIHAPPYQYRPVGQRTGGRRTDGRRSPTLPQRACARVRGRCFRCLKFGLFTANRQQWCRSAGWFSHQPAGFSSQWYYSSISRYSISLSHNQLLQCFGFFFRQVNGANNASNGVHYYFIQVHDSLRCCYNLHNCSTIILHF